MINFIDKKYKYDLKEIEIFINATNITCKKYKIDPDKSSKAQHSDPHSSSSAHQNKSS